MKKFKEIVAAGLMVALLAGVTQASIVGATITLKVVETPAVSVYTSQGQTDTTLVVTPVPVDLDGNVLTMSNFGSAPTVTVDPGVLNQEEIESFTTITNNGNNTATLSGMTRDLQSVYPYTSTNTGKQHGGGAVVVFSNNPQLYGRLAAPENDNVWTGLQTYSLSNQPVYNGNPTFSNPLALVDKAYTDALSIVGAPTSTFNGMGVVWLATNAQVSAGTASSTTGAPLVIPAKVASSTYNPSTVFQGEIPALRSTFTIDPMFIATSSGNNYSFGGIIGFTGSSTFTGTTTLQGTTTIAANASHTLTLNNVPYIAPSSQGAASTVLSNNGAGTLSWSALVPPKYNVVSSSGPTASGVGTQTSTSTDSITVPAGTLSASSTITVKGVGGCSSGSGPASPTCTFNLVNGSGVVMASCGFSQTANTSYASFVDFTIYNQSSASVQKGIAQCSINDSGAQTDFYSGGNISSSINTANALTLFMQVQSTSGGAPAGQASLGAFSILITP